MKQHMCWLNLMEIKMKKIGALVAAALFTSFSSTAIANDADNSGAYLGAKFGNASLDVDGFDDMSGNGLFFGYQFESGAFAELEMASYSSDSYGFDFEIDTTAIYFGGRAGDDFYFKYKIGLLNEDVSASGWGFSEDESDSGFSYGLGVGYQIENALIELEYTVIETDVSAITLGAAFRF